MKIEIDDTVAPWRRIELYKVLYFKYGLDKFKGHRGYASSFLGISRRSLVNNIKRYDELKEYRIKPAKKGKYCE